MAFPVNPTNGQAATVNNISYVYNSTLGAWVSNQISTNANLTVAGNITVAGQINQLTITPSGTSNADLSTISNVTAQSYSASLFYTSVRNITANTSIAANSNAMSAGPITINDNIVVTIETGAEWSVV